MEVILQYNSVFLRNKLSKLFWIVHESVRKVCMNTEYVMQTEAVPENVLGTPEKSLL